MWEPSRPIYQGAIVVVVTEGFLGSDGGTGQASSRNLFTGRQCGLWEYRCLQTTGFKEKQSSEAENLARTSVAFQVDLPIS